MMMKNVVTIIIVSVITICSLMRNNDGGIVVHAASTVGSTTTKDQQRRTLQQLIPFQAISSNVSLPDGFQIGYGPIGRTLMWSSSSIKTTIGDARPEFRVSSSHDIFGYPHEIQNELHLPITTADEERLRTVGMTLEVWKSGRRLDRVVSNNGGRTRSRKQTTLTSSTPQVNINPAARGRFSVRTVSYDLPTLNVTNYQSPLEVLGEMYLPITSQSNLPLVLFLHGRHVTCYEGGPNGTSYLGWPCDEGYEPIPSHQGYRYIGEILASQGYVVVSISANAINGQDGGQFDAGVGARSVLIRHHLQILARWNKYGGDPWNNILKRKLDLDDVVLVGHSRGGEGVHRAAIDTIPSDPYRIVGLVSYGPTSFGNQVTPDVHSATILPTCDGDVSDLQGQDFIDRSRDIAYSEALRSAVIALGANHNYFNTEWTPGLAKAESFDDWYIPDDPICGDTGSLRLTPQEQQTVGAAYTAALVRLAVKRDKTMLPILDGSYVRPAAIGRAEVAVSGIGGAHYRILYTPNDIGLPINVQNGMNGFVCAGRSFLRPTSFNSNISLCGSDYGTGNFDFNSPHFWPYIGPPLLGYEMNWTSSSSTVGAATAKFTLSSSTQNLLYDNWLDFRIANDPALPPVNFTVVLTDNRGRTVIVPLSNSVLDGWLGTGDLDRIHARTIRGRLQSPQVLRSSINLARIASISLTTNTPSGRVWLLDVAVSRDYVAQPEVLNLPVVSVDSAVSTVVQEGSIGGSIDFVVTVSPIPTSDGLVWIQNFATGELLPINITIGSPKVLLTLPTSWIGNDIFDYRTRSRSYRLVTDYNALIGNYVVGLTIIEDDVKPTVSVIAPDVIATEGESLTWTFELSAPSNGVFYYLFAIPPDSGDELYMDDVDPNWLSQNIFPFPTYPTEPQPLSQVSTYVYLPFPDGITTVNVTIPIIMDNKTEGLESIRLELLDFWVENPLQPPLFLTGTVPANSL